MDLDPCEASSESEEDVQQRSVNLLRLSYLLTVMYHRLRSMSPEVPWPSDQPSRYDDSGILWYYQTKHNRRPEEKSEGDEGEDNETPPPYVHVVVYIYNV